MGAKEGDARAGLLGGEPSKCRIVQPGHSFRSKGAAMKTFHDPRRFSFLLAVLLVMTPMFWASASADELEDAEATIEALQTQVADQEATIQALESDRLPEPPATEVPTAPVQPQSNPDGVSLEIGARLETAAWSIEVTGVEQQSSIELYETFTAQGVYLLVTFRVANLTNIPLELDYDELVVSDEAGREYSYQDTITPNLLNDRYDPLFEYSMLQPALSYESVIVFEIPVETTSLRLVLNDRSGNRADEARAAANTASQLALPAGSNIVFDTWDVKVDRTETLTSFTSIWGTHAPRGQFLVLFITVTNTGLEPLSFPYESMRLLDGNGRWFSFIEPPTDGMALELTDAQYWERLQPGIPYQAGIVFDIPTDASELILVARFEEAEIAVRL